MPEDIGANRFHILGRDITAMPKKSVRSIGWM